MLAENHKIHAGSLLKREHIPSFHKTVIFQFGSHLKIRCTVYGSTQGTHHQREKKIKNCQCVTKTDK